MIATEGGRSFDNVYPNNDANSNDLLNDNVQNGYSLDTYQHHPVMPSTFVDHPSLPHSTAYLPTSPLLTGQPTALSSLPPLSVFTAVPSTTATPNTISTLKRKPHAILAQYHASLNDESICQKWNTAVKRLR